MKTSGVHHNRCCDGVAYTRLAGCLATLSPARRTASALSMTPLKQRADALGPCLGLTGNFLYLAYLSLRISIIQISTERAAPTTKSSIDFSVGSQSAELVLGEIAWCPIVAVLPHAHSSIIVQADPYTHFVVAWVNTSSILK